MILMVVAGFYVFSPSIVHPDIPDRSEENAGTAHPGEMPERISHPLRRPGLQFNIGN
jgi:hypothetical protein